MVKRQRQTIIRYHCFFLLRLTSSDYCLSLSFDHCFFLLLLTASDYCLSLSFDHCFVLLRLTSSDYCLSLSFDHCFFLLRLTSYDYCLFQKTETDNNQKPLILGGKKQWSKDRDKQ
jgi:hypothetical protein